MPRKPAGGEASPVRTNAFGKAEPFRTSGGRAAIHSLTPNSAGARVRQLHFQNHKAVFALLFILNCVDKILNVAVVGFVFISASFDFFSAI